MNSVSGLALTGSSSYWYVLKSSQKLLSRIRFIRIGSACAGKEFEKAGRIEE